VGRLLIEVLPAGFYRLRHTDMLTGHDRVNTYDFRCRPSLLPKEVRCGQALGAFSAKLRDETDLESLNVELAAVVRNTMRPERNVFWLQGSEKDG
jgi:hypothetical protein